MVMVAVALTALMGIAALVIDLGLLYVAKQNAQNTADQCAVSALAAVTNYTDATIERTEANAEVSKAFSYILTAYPRMTKGADTRTASVTNFFGVGLNHWIHNSTTAPPIHFYADADYQFDVSVQVACAVPVDMTFARMFGLTTKTAQGDAVARLYSVPYMDYAFAPWAVRKSTVFPVSGGGIQVGVGGAGGDVIWTLTNPGGTTMNPDGFTAIALPNTYADRLAGSAAATRLTSDLPAEPPATSVVPSYVRILAPQSGFNSATISALTTRFGTGAGVDDGSYSNWSSAGQSGSYSDSNRILMVPIVNDTAQPDGTFRVRGFAPVFVTSYDVDKGEVHFILLSATWTGGKLRWNLKAKPRSTTSMVSKIMLYDFGTTLSTRAGG